MYCADASAPLGAASNRVGIPESEGPGVTWSADGRAPATRAGWPAADPDAADSLGSEVPCLGITGHENSQSCDLIPGAVFSIDYLETGGLVAWEEDRSHVPMHHLLSLRQSAKERGEAEPYQLAGRDVLVYGSGIGNGKRAHMDLRIELPGVRLGLAYRQSDRRGNANFYLNVTGEACVIDGALRIHDWVHQTLEELGGDLRDEWMKRIDICLDLPGIGLQDWMGPAFHNGHFKTASREWGCHEGKEGKHGLVLPTGSCRLSIYDKLRETYSKKKELYRLAMGQRWGGCKPLAATRIEFQLRKPWLDQYGLRTTDAVLQNLPAIVLLLMQTDSRPFFCFTDGAVDRENQHQSRSSVHPEWLRIVRTMVALAGRPSEPLARVDRGQITAERACRNAIGYLTSAAAEQGAELTSVEDVGHYLIQLAHQNEIGDGHVQASLAKKTQQRCTRTESTEFPYGQNVNGGVA